MKNIDLGQTVAILANIGVIASLIFVGVQVQQGAAATRSATVLQLKDSWVQLNIAAATSGELANAGEALRERDWDGISERDRSLLEGLYRTLFHNWSNAYYQYRNGTLDSNQWGAYEREARRNAENPTVIRVWTDWNYVYDDDFRRFMQGLIEDAGIQ